MPSTDPVSSITNCWRLVVSYTEPVHGFIISQRTVEPTGSSIYYCLLLLMFLVCKGETELDLVELPQAEYLNEEETGQLTARNDFD